MSGQPLVIFENVQITRPGGNVVLDGVSWTLRDGETWAITGPMGSGKTTFAEAVLGRLHASAGTITWPLLTMLNDAGRKVDWPSEVIRLVAFKENSRLFSYADHYYQQRFEFADEDQPLSLDGYLRDGLNATDAEIESVANRLGIVGLRELSFIKLSNGQVRRARIARALLAKPELLILDNPYVGLDVAGRAELDAILGELVRGGQRVLLIASHVPAWVRNVFELKAAALRRDAESSKRMPDAPITGDSASRLNVATPIVEMHHVNVTHGGKPILTDVSWTVRAGERWALLGPNGAGKTTLLSLLCGDHPQAYANDIRLFGQRRGSGESIWDVKRRVGLVSPELHLYFTTPLSAFEAAVTGFHDVLSYREATPEQTATVRSLFTHFRLMHLENKPFGRLSTGEQRMVLLVRALVKQPALLILDEPFQGFDGETMQRMRSWLDHELRPDQSLIFVSHLEEEIPESVTKRLNLEGGRLIADPD